MVEKETLCLLCTRCSWRVRRTGCLGQLQTQDSAPEGKFIPMACDSLAKRSYLKGSGNKGTSTGKAWKMLKQLRTAALAEIAKSYNYDNSRGHDGENDKIVNPPLFTQLWAGHLASFPFSPPLCSIGFVFSTFHACVFYPPKLWILGKQKHYFLPSYLLSTCIKNVLKKHLSFDLLLRTLIYL